ncbi:MAG: LPS export ABC transporter periplasmic protein LptC [Alphaproteobacteria bacterium]|nr:LPS export ABC transporter periplasmic protein LptC [Alphaproteobacteria bacterium]
MIRKLTIVSAALALGLTATAALAQEAKKSKQTDIEANQMEIIDAEKKAIFKGDVKAVRGDTTMRSDVMVVFYEEVKQPDGSTKTDATNIDATGSVVIKTRKETITGDRAQINPQTNKVVVTGNVKLVQGATVLTGPELRADLDADRVEMLGGRVKGSFLPK